MTRNQSLEWALTTERSPWKIKIQERNVFGRLQREGWLSLCQILQRGIYLSDLTAVQGLAFSFLGSKTEKTWICQHTKGRSVDWALSHINQVHRRQTCKSKCHFTNLQWQLKSAGRSDIHFVSSTFSPCGEIYVGSQTIIRRQPGEPGIRARRGAGCLEY